MIKAALAKTGKETAQPYMNLFVFVLMPFKKMLNKRYEAIKSIAEKAGMRAERVASSSLFGRA